MVERRGLAMRENGKAGGGQVGYKQVERFCWR